MKFISTISAVFAFLFSAYLIAQAESHDLQTDSLENLLSIEKDLDLRLDLLVKLMNLNNFRDKEKALEYANQLFNESESLSPHVKNIKAQLFIAKSLQNKSKIDSSITILDKALEDAKAINDITQIWNCYMYLGNASDMRNDLDGAYDYFLKGFFTGFRNACVTIAR